MVEVPPAEPSDGRMHPSDAPPGFGAGPPPGDFAAVAWAVAGRPDLWWTALGALRRLAAPGWWRSRPRLPLPDGPLWRFRMVTAYGRPDAVPERSDVLSYLEWCRATAPTRSHGARPPGSAGAGSRRDPSRSG
jgi:hypothetical protein